MQEWYKQAAAQGYANAQAYLGLLYANGQGVPQDFVQARQWFEKAAAQGLATAQYNLGMLYDNGYGVPRDVVQAHKWYYLAGWNGNKKATGRRGLLAILMTPAQLAEAQKLAREWKPTTSSK